MRGSGQLSQIYSRKPAVTAFRGLTDANPWLLCAWQLAKGEFEPQSSKMYGNIYIDGVASAENARRAIEGKHKKYLCLGDAKSLNGDEFDECKHIAAKPSIARIQIQAFTRGAKGA